MKDRDCRARQGAGHKPALQAFRSPLAAAAAALALLIQVALLPYHQAFPAQAAAPAINYERVAAELEATFGDAAALCVRSDGGAPHAPAGDCDDHCPFCRFAAQAASLVAPDLPSLPARREGSGQALAPPAAASALLLRPSGQNRARAPPLPV